MLSSMDDGIKVVISPPLAERLKSAAEEAGISVNTLVDRTLEAWLDSWQEDLRRIDEPGEDVPAGEAFERFEARIRERLKERG